MLGRVMVRRFNAISEISETMKAPSGPGGAPIVAVVASIAIGVTGYLFGFGDDDKKQKSDTNTAQHKDIIATTLQEIPKYQSVTEYIREHTGIDDSAWIKAQLDKLT
jgi:hypothetical protein